MDTAVNNPLQDNSTPSAVATVRRRWHWTTWVVALLMLILCVIVNLGGDNNPLTEHIDYGLPWVYCEYRPTEYPHVWFSPFAQTVESKTWYYFWPLMGNVFVGGLLVATTSYLWERRVRRLKGWLRFTLRDWLWLCVFMAAGYSWFMSLYHDNRILDELVKRFEMNESQNKAVISDTIECRNGDIPFDWFWDFINLRHEVRPLRIYNLIYASGNDGNLQMITHLNSLQILSLDHPENITSEGWKSLRHLGHLTTLNISVPNYVDAETLALLQSIPKLKRLIITVRNVDEKWITALRDMPALEEIEIFSLETKMRSSFFPTPGKGLNAEDEAKFREYFLTPPKTGTDDVDQP